MVPCQATDWGGPVGGGSPGDQSLAPTSTRRSAAG